MAALARLRSQEKTMARLFGDFRRDWRRWTQTERLSAGLIVMVAVLGSAVLLLGI
jgi:hypothetical protein